MIPNQKTVLIFKKGANVKELALLLQAETKRS
jgi:hypothetical protein